MRERAFRDRADWGAVGAVSNRSEDFKALFHEHYRSVYFFFTNRGVSVEEARDLTQETFLRAYKGMEVFRYEASFKTWLFQIATNLWRNTIRSRSAAKRDAPEVSLEDELNSGCSILSDQGGSQGHDSPLSRVLSDEAIEQLENAIEELPDQMRRCAQLRIFQELKYREIAELMKLSIETVKSQLHQARQRLRRRLSDYFDDIDF